MQNLSCGFMAECEVQRENSRQGALEIRREKKMHRWKCGKRLSKSLGVGQPFLGRENFVLVFFWDP